MLTIIPHDALTGNLNIIGGKVGFPVKGVGLTPTPGMASTGYLAGVTTGGDSDNEESLRD